MGTAPEGYIKVEVYIKKHSQLQQDLDTYREIRHLKYGPAALVILADWSENRHRPQSHWIMGGALSPSSNGTDQAQREEQDRQAKANVKQSAKAMKWI